jgi:hypothetical protein
MASYLLISLGTPKEEVSMEKKYKAMIYIVACLSVLAMGATIALASSGYIGLLYNQLSPPLVPPRLEDLRCTYFVWRPSNAYCNITIRNIGSSSVTINQVVQVEIDNTKETLDAPVLPYTLTKDSSVTIKVTSTFNSRMLYSFMVVTAKGNQFGPFRGTPP